MEALNEQQYPLVKLVLEQALEPELVRVQALQVQAPARVLQVQALQVQALRVQARLELKRHLQQSCPKLQPHRHRCKVPDRSREPP